MVLYDVSGSSQQSTIRARYSDTKYSRLLLSDKASFDHVDEWVDAVRAEAGPNVLLYICGNKTDRDHRAVSYVEGQHKADRLSAGFMEMSALTGYNVRSCFVRIVSNLQAAYYVAHEDDQEKLEAVELQAVAQLPMQSKCSC
jgi:GTPase SAR1 family protein